MSKQDNSSEQMVNLLYNTGYRLTGSHRKTQELLTGVFNTVSDNISIKTALKKLCLTYINKASTGWTPSLPESSPPTKDNSTNKIQAALLALPPAVRLVLVLREVSGLNYVEIAEMTGIEKIAVTWLLSTGRWELRKQLAPPRGQSELPDKYFARSKL
ncbi:RNA polymerase sigma factor [Desulfallas thermosapovorans]|uniref:RNA polymerase sigma-70 factor (ECF subfamily) n=1 Tax=Desulfallas thermosapovorans DSM 6562 TaxID=1121431 RepID=A0A5S4ZNS5_9FIRM|nr:sigma factor-like helix-turn-helix DNA-binding protein [Desulfallas thermosapovorans]TYO93290.1 RNA polymerase sigma-70 factor (ECF subfamily) [Desulfallas thermosapovorans DSM 6562]